MAWAKYREVYRHAGRRIFLRHLSVDNGEIFNMRRYCLIFFLIFALFLTACTSKAAKDQTTDAEKTVSEETVDSKNDTSAKVTEKTTETEQTTDNNSTTKSEVSADVAAKPAAQQVTEQTKTTDKAILHVYGDGVKQECWFSMAQLKAMSDGYAEAEYYYRGKDPDKGHSLCKGVRLGYLLDTVVGLTDDAKKVTIKASDGYGVGYSLAAVRKTYIDETDSTLKLYMILAWFYDGQTSDSLNLVMGQNVAGEYNRTYWVQNVISIEVKTQ